MIAVCTISEGRDPARLAAIHDACCVGQTAIMTLAVVPALDLAVVTLLGRPDELVEGIAVAALVAVRGFEAARFLWLTDAERPAAEATAEALGHLSAVPATATQPFVLLLIDLPDRHVLAHAPASQPGVAAALLLAHPEARAAELLAPCPAAALEGWPDGVPLEHRSWAAL